MTLRRISAVVLFFVLASTSVPAIQKRVVVGDDVFYVSTNTAHGECRGRDLADGTVDWICQDEAHFAALNTKVGCLDSGGAGYCARNRPTETGESGSQLNCPDGTDYILHAGIWNVTAVSKTE